MGLAVCEALARTPQTSVAPDEPLPDGLWGDGTSMALALAESLAECGGVDERDQMIRLTSWFRYGYQSSGETCDAIDDAVKAAILRFERTWNPVDDARTEGDACLARVAPTAIFFAGSREAALDAGARAARITHSGRKSVDACRLLAAMLDEALTGTDKQRVLRPQPPADLCPEAAILCRTTPPSGDYPAGRALDARHGRLWAAGRRLVRFRGHTRRLETKPGPRRAAAEGGGIAAEKLKSAETCQNHPPSVAWERLCGAPIFLRPRPCGCCPFAEQHRP
jgi:ADP-ribosyl-[dinitrogen reductase] hydrolase